MDTTLVTSCRQCRTFWPADSEPRCTDASHDHAEHIVHRHHDRVAIADGVEVVATSFDVSDPYQRTDLPDFGLYLDDRWDPPWPHQHLAWPDFGVPDARELTAALDDVLGRVRQGATVEIGCLGGHGRTGTALACLAVLSGVPADQAVAKIRKDYCDRAVETSDQESFVGTFAR